MLKKDSFWRPNEARASFQGGGKVLSGFADGALFTFSE